jgi:NADP-dependent 3-hydroxy acid dehydrogenase YdfG
MNNYVKGKVVVITGAGSNGGFGRITAEKLALMGAKVVISDINDEGIRDAVAAIKEKGGEVAGKRADVTKYEDNVELVKFAVDTYGQLDVFIANAGIMPNAGWASHEKAIEAWDACIDINLKGTVHGIGACYDIMIEQETGGHFIGISSIFANFPTLGSGVYAATKIGVRYLVTSLRQEAVGKIKTTIINPTGVRTPLYDTIVDNKNSYGLIGWNLSEIAERYKLAQEGKQDPRFNDINSILNEDIAPGDIADSIVYAINQPLGLVISEITVRSSNELRIL